MCKIGILLTGTVCVYVCMCALRSVNSEIKAKLFYTLVHLSFLLLLNGMECNNNNNNVMVQNFNERP